MSPSTVAAPSSTPGIGRRAVASLWAAALMPYLTLAIWVPLSRAAGRFASVPIPWLVVLSMLTGALLVALMPRLAAPLPRCLDNWFGPEHRRLSLLWSAGALFALFQIGRNATFLGDPSYVSCSIAPDDPFLTRHSCLTAYIHGAILSADPSANVYDMAFVHTSGILEAPLPPTASHFAPFTLDAYGYPPPFLLFPRALFLLTTDFLSLRMLFASSSWALAFFACAAAANTLGGVAERRTWLLTPLFMSSPLVLVTLQVGNFHLAAVAICLLAWVALERQQHGLKGGLLATATLSKIFPGLLGIILLMQRRWRAVIFTVLAAAFLCAFSVAVLGTKVWRDFFFYHMPRVQSGEALGFMADSLQSIEFNLAPFGIPFKLGALGFEGWGWNQARRIGTIYTFVLVGLAVLASRNKGQPQHRMSVWLALVMLGSLQSPYAAAFVLVTVTLLLLSMVAEVRSKLGLLGFVSAYLAFQIFPPGIEPKTAVAISLVRVVALYAFLVWVVVRKERAAL